MKKLENVYNSTVFDIIFSGRVSLIFSPLENAPFAGHVSDWRNLPVTLHVFNDSRIKNELNHSHSHHNITCFVYTSVMQLFCNFL